MEPWGGNDATSAYPDLARIVATARRWWWALLVGTLLVAGLALASGSGGTTYQASTRLLVGPVGGNDLSALRAAGQQAATLASLSSSSDVLEAARARIDNALTVGQLRSGVKTKADDVTRLLTITFQADGPALAAAAANAIAFELRTFGTTSPSAASARNVSVVERATVPRRPIDGGSPALVIVAALAGLLGTLTVFVLADLARGTIGTEEELARASSAPVLGTAGRHAGGLLGAAALLGSRHERIVVAGVEDDGSGARTALGLARALATGSGRVLLVDADYGPRALSRSLDLHRRAGLAEAAASADALHDASDLAALTVAVGPRVALLPRGRTPIEPEEAHALLVQLTRLADIVVVSGPSATGVPGAVGWTRISDGAVIGVRRGHVTRDRASSAVEVLERSSATVLGTVLVPRGLRRRALVRTRARVDAELSARTPTTPAATRASAG